MRLRWATFIAVAAIDLAFGAIGMWIIVSFANGMAAFENDGESSAGAVDIALVGAAIIAGMFVVGGVFVAALRASNGDRPGLLPLASAALFAVAHLIVTLLFAVAMIEDFPDSTSIATAVYFVATSTLILWLLVPLAADDQNWSSHRTA